MMKRPAHSVPWSLTGLFALIPLAAAQGADARAYWHFSGAFHPAVSHFPIALLVVAGVVEAWRFVRGKKIPGDAGYTCLMLGSAGAVVAAVLGWANADHAGEFNGSKAQVLMLHRWMGVGVAVLSVIMAVIATRSRGDGVLTGVRKLGFVAGLLACTALVGATGSYGGKLTFGIDYYEIVYNETIGASKNPKPDLVDVSENKDKGVDPALTDPKTKDGKNVSNQHATGSDGAKDGGTDPGTALARVSYVAHIKPLFTASCIKCHGDEKAKSDYRMDTRALALTAGASGEPAIIPGNARDSLLVKVIEGKGEYADMMMPPKGDPLTPQQIALVRRWIDEGAVWDE